MLLDVPVQDVGSVLSVFETALMLTHSYIDGDYRYGVADNKKPEIKLGANEILPEGTTDERIVDLERRLKEKDSWGWKVYREKAELEKQIKELEAKYTKVEDESHVGFGVDSLSSPYQF
jgi:hypothetical protein